MTLLAQSTGRRKRAVARVRVSPGDGTITVSFNCGDNALNNIDTRGQKFSFTMRYYGVSQEVIDGKIDPTVTISRGE